MQGTGRNLWRVARFLWANGFRRCPTVVPQNQLGRQWRLLNLVAFTSSKSKRRLVMPAATAAGPLLSLLHLLGLLCVSLLQLLGLLLVLLLHLLHFRRRSVLSR
jgi:hypothetical protein